MDVGGLGGFGNTFLSKPSDPPKTTVVNRKKFWLRASADLCLRKLRKLARPIYVGNYRNFRP